LNAEEIGESPADWENACNYRHLGEEGDFSLIVNKVNFTLITSITSEDLLTENAVSLWVL
jgi:hypothetical protein